MRGAALILLGALLAVGVLFGLTQLPGNRFNPLALTEDTPPAPVTVPEENLIGKQAEAWGIANCLGGIATLADYLTQNTDYNFRLVRGEDDANSQMVSGVVAVHERELNLAGISGFHAAPIRGGRCNLAYQTTVYFEEPCAAVREKYYAGFSQQIDFGQVAAVFTAPETLASIYMMPAGAAGCVAVRAETIY